MGMPGSVPRSPHLLLALVVVVWAGSYAAIKQLIDDGLAAPDIALGRYLVAAPGFAIALVATRGMPGLGRRDLARLLVAGLLVVTIYHLSLNAGERLTTAGTASVVSRRRRGSRSRWRSPSARSGSPADGRPASRYRSWALSWSCCSARASGSRSRTCTGRCSSSPRRLPSRPST